jgi:hypothetical protein
MDFSKFIDAYTARARLLPALLLVLPLAVTVYAWEPGNALGWNGLGGLIVASGGTILLSFIARDMGKDAEVKLFKKWGGGPSDLLLMHSGDMDPTLRDRRHAAIRTLWPDVPVPTVAEEATDRNAVYARFGAIVKLIIARSRDKARYALLFEENCNYGFRRNMFGVRWLGFSIAAICSVALGLQLYILFSSHERLAVLSLGLELVNVAMLIVWPLWANEESVRRGADLYNDRLFETLDMVPAQY